MKSKYIIFPEAEKVVLLEKEIEPPKDNQVQVCLDYSSISSGTERANIAGEVNVSVVDFSTVAQFPRRSGYSSAGTVCAVGKCVSDIKVGDRVALSWSTHSSVINIDAENVYVLSDAVCAKDAALFHIATFPLAAIRKCRFEIGESAIIMGLGVLGLLAIPLLRSAGAVPIIAVDPIEEKRNKALKAGADFALNPLAPDFAETVKAITNGGANVAIEVTGVGKALDGVLDCMAKFGRVALLGCTRSSDFTIDYYHKVHGPGISLIGAHTLARPKHDSSNGYWSQSDDMNCLIKLTQAGRINLSSIVDEVHSPADAPEIYTRLLKESAFPVVQFDWSKVR